MTPADIRWLQSQLDCPEYTTDYDVRIYQVAIMCEDYTPRMWDELIDALKAQGRCWLAGTVECARSQVDTLARLEATVYDEDDEVVVPLEYEMDEDFRPPYWWGR